METSNGRSILTRFWDLILLLVNCELLQKHSKVGNKRHQILGIIKIYRGVANRIQGGFEITGIVIRERVHLFADDVRITADGAGKEIGRLKDGRADFAEAVGGEEFVGGLLDAVPESGVWREQVACAADGLEFGFVGHSSRSRENPFFYQEEVTSG